MARTLLGPRGEPDKARPTRYTQPQFALGLPHRQESDWESRGVSEREVGKRVADRRGELEPVARKSRGHDDVPEPGVTIDDEALAWRHGVQADRVRLRSGVKVRQHRANELLDRFDVLFAAVAIDAAGNIYTAEAQLRGITKYVRASSPPRN